MERIINYAVTNRFLVTAGFLMAAFAGFQALRGLTIDAVPDITPVQVQVLTRAPALAPLEVEQFITYPVEAAMSGLPGLKEIRSTSRYGLSAVTVIFEEGVDRYFARQLVNERSTPFPLRWANRLWGHSRLDSVKSISSLSEARDTRQWN